MLATAKSLQSCPTLCDPIDGSPPGFPVPGVLLARTLEWVAICFSNAWKWKVKVKSLSHVRLFVTPWTAAYQAPPSMGFSRQEYWSGVPWWLQMLLTQSWGQFCLKPRKGNVYFLYVTLFKCGTWRRYSHFQITACFFVSSSTSSNSSGFSVYRSLISLVNFFPRYFILFVAIVNEIVFLISLSAHSSWVYGNTPDFGILIL